MEDLAAQSGKKTNDNKVKFLKSLLHKLDSMLFCVYNKSDFVQYRTTEIGQTEDDMEINKYLIKLITAAKGLEQLDLFMGKATLSKTEFRLLQEVVMEQEKGNDIISSELARRLGITRSAISQLVTKLERENIVKRAPSDIDRKIAYIRLSDYATAMFIQQCERANAVMEELEEQFGKERLEGFFAEYDELCNSFCSLKRTY